MIRIVALLAALAAVAGCTDRQLQGSGMVLGAMAGAYASTYQPPAYVPTTYCNHIGYSIICRTY